jgi:NAD(P)-dependent dehydrogenase (short-subunit alcohol dehydrogenase family)
LHIYTSNNSIQLQFFSGDELKEELSSIDGLSKQRLDELSELFLKDFKDGQLEAQGWPNEGGFAAYKASKALANAYSRILAKEHPSLRINCVHPGYVQTDMNFGSGHLTVEEGARAGSSHAGHGAQGRRHWRVFRPHRGCVLRVICSPLHSHR